MDDVSQSKSEKYKVNQFHLMTMSVVVCCFFFLIKNCLRYIANETFDQEVFFKHLYFYFNILIYIKYDWWKFERHSWETTPI